MVGRGKEAHADTRTCPQTDEAASHISTSAPRHTIASNEGQDAASGYIAVKYWCRCRPPDMQLSGILD